MEGFRSIDLNPVEHLWDVIFDPNLAASSHLRLCRSSAMPWSRCGTRSPRLQFIMSLGPCQACIQAHGGPHKLLSTILCSCNEILSK